jgi:hypothetical protein
MARGGVATPRWLVILMLVPALLAGFGCSSLERLYPPPPPPSVGPLSLVPANLDYGPNKLNTSTRTHIFILSNPPTNDGAAIITEVGSSGPPFLIDAGAGNCTAGLTLAVGAHCQIGVKFAPTAPGRQTGTLAISDNASDSPQIATLEGSGN